MPILVVDLFAGPGGLGEGFSAAEGAEGFRLALSVEKDPTAHRTLWLRALYRRIETRSAYAAFRKDRQGSGIKELESLRIAYPRAAAEADDEAICAELAPVSHHEIGERVRRALGGSDRWVLIGGPPCQAYSLVGRSRMRRIRGEAFESDERHFLYQEYLRILADHRPPVFVMENVKGLLSSQLDGGNIVGQILNDLESPSSAIRGHAGPREYAVLPIVESDRNGLARFVVRAEEHGVPQARHRVILLGVREDVGRRPALLAPSTVRVSTRDVIADLPAVRSGLSMGPDTADRWLETVAAGATVIRDAISSWNSNPPVLETDSLHAAISDALDRAPTHRSRGAAYSDASEGPKEYASWYRDTELDGITGHFTRSHMPSDLWRYLFASSYAAAYLRSPNLSHFPPALLPQHKNVVPGGISIFGDRFRVQLPNIPSTTVTSHISKDGHSFIHFDPSQVRSLTPREAARLQTFPDSYEFIGSSTAQMHQIGNAVPPLLAREIGKVVRDLF